MAKITEMQNKTNELLAKQLAVWFGDLTQLQPPPQQDHHHHNKTTTTTTTRPPHEQVVVAIAIPGTDGLAPHTHTDQ
jgi:hypothetical protein